MIYTNKHGTVDFWEHPELIEHKKIMINFSGGTDSALMTWMLCEELTKLNSNEEIHFSTLVDEDRPTNEWNARELVLWFKERYNLNWAEHHVGYFRKGYTDGIHAKRFYHGVHTTSVRKPNKLTMLMHGRTANPPAATMKEHDLVRDREDVRDTPRPIVMTVGKAQTYTPFAAAAKDFVAVVYEQHDLRELFEMTASCISDADKTEYFTKPCKTCWWCREKLWAFGCYDYGHM